MRAVRYHQIGSPDILKLDDVPQPVPAPGEVVLKVRAAALNRLDVFLRAGATTMPGWKLPHIGGFDIAGEVVDIGPGVPKEKLGLEAMIKARVFGPSARGKLDIIGISRPGGFAEYVAVPVECLGRKPAAYTWEQAAAYPCCHITANYGLVLHARIKPGESVLVHGGGSGAGAAACQVAKVAGASVITTVGSDEKAAKARDLLHVDRAVNYRKEDVVAAVKQFTAGRGVDIVFDPVFGASVPATIESLALRGRWILLGMVGGPAAEIVAAKLMFKEITVQGIVEFYSSDEQMEAAFGLAHQDKLRPIVDKVWPLDKLADAHRQMEAGAFFGKIVVRP